MPKRDPTASQMGPPRGHFSTIWLSFLRIPLSLVFGTRFQFPWISKNSENCNTVGLLCMAPRPAEAPWQVASWCDEASSRRQVVLTVCVGKAWWPNCATVLRFSLGLMYRACKLTRGEGEDDRTENKPKIRKVVFYRRCSPVLERPLAAQVELDGQVSGLAAS